MQSAGASGISWSLQMPTVNVDTSEVLPLAPFTESLPKIAGDWCIFLPLQDMFKVHSENNSPFLTITSMTRVIEVSHWGNIAVEENVDLKHTGAVLKGPFSRYDYQRQPDSGVSSVRSFKVWADGPGPWWTL